MPRVPYENHTFFLNLALNVQELQADSVSASTTLFALDNATRQPRRRAESLPWSHPTSVLRLGSQRNSIQLPKAPSIIQAERDRDVEMGWQDDLGDMGREREHDYYLTT